jgi:hypothetical protein
MINPPPFLTQAKSRQNTLGPETPSWISLGEVIAYPENHQAHMNYADYRKVGYFIGSGVQAGCKTLVGQRLKASGMFWGEIGAINIRTVPTANLSQNQFDEFWEAA